MMKDLNWLAILFLIFLNGYFVACEIIIVTARKTKIDEYIKKGRKRARLVRVVIDNMATYLPVTQVGVTLTSIGLGIVAAPILEKFIQIIFPPFILNFLTIKSKFSLLPYISFLVITYIQLTFGELIPKTIAMRQPEKYSLFIIPPLFLFSYIFRPLTMIVNITTYSLLSVFRIKDSFKERPYSEDEIKMILSSSGRDGIISEMEKEMTSNIFRLKKMKVKNIMISRTEIVGFETNKSIGSIRKKIAQNKWSYNRYPVYKKNWNNVIGFIHISDIYQAKVKAKDQIIAESIVKRILFFNHMENADIILLSMKRQGINAAIILDDKRSMVGLITISDIIEQVIKNS